MERQTAYALAQGFLEQLTELEEALQLRREMPNIVFDEEIDQDPSVLAANARRAEMMSGTDSHVLGVGNASLYLFMARPEPREENLREICKNAAIEYLTQPFVEKFRDIDAALRNETRAIGAAQFPNMNEPAKFWYCIRDGKFAIAPQMGNYALACPAPDAARNFIAIYAKALALSHTKPELVEDKDLPGMLAEKTAPLFDGETSQFEKVQQLATNMGLIACPLYGRAGFTKALGLPRDDFHHYLNRLYAEARKPKPF